MSYRKIGQVEYKVARVWDGDAPFAVVRSWDTGKVVVFRGSLRKCRLWLAMR